MCFIFQPDNLLSCLLVAGTILQLMSLAATSLIEREDKVWYHFFMFVLMFTVSSSLVKELNFIPSISQSFVELNHFYNKHFITVAKWMILLIAHRVLKNFQECQYDFTIYWLSKQDTKVYLSVISIAGKYCFVYYCS